MNNKIYSLMKKFSNILRFFPYRLRTSLYEINTGTNFKIQLAIRYIILASIAKQIGNNVYIGKNVSLKNMKNTIIGDNVSIHDMCYIDGYGGLEIGNNVSIAHSSTLITTNHTWNDTTIPIKYNEVSKGKIVIKDDVWIGCGVRVLSNVTINQRSVVAAGSIVVKDLESGWLGAGVPMKNIKKLEE
ncbi:acyltransferase [Staphylococcus gallinarum]|uniref:acyltransferase n=1 Tax=Staphylococcus gallinarum TaxID=1293 RepID=UPI000D1C40EA|nr:acyltransferase [Staphylococcus gallinarum]MBU7218151.1 acyltransferase [Staphylococcus gallinarum]MCD8794632.1 acyltransferase [Staphylococcus gallinarum]PTE30931.1 acetyltransferase [Staphylococcus gallinarum]PTK91234.1 acetyltransferase [Staphylococcus gallinarum]RIL18442.1 acyltransferase [Staphylococcus gallinarum]